MKPNELSVYGDRSVAELATRSAQVVEWPTPGPEHAHAEIARERGNPEHSGAPLPPTPATQQ